MYIDEQSEEDSFLLKLPQIPCTEKSTLSLCELNLGERVWSGEDMTVLYLIEINPNHIIFYSIISSCV